MGSWGMGPFENDRAGDMIAGFTKPITKLLCASEEHARDHYEEARAAIAIITIAAGSDILGGPDLDDCLAALNRIRNDDAWLDNWKDGNAIRRAIDEQILALARAMGRPHKILALETKEKTRGSRKKRRKS